MVIWTTINRQERLDGYQGRLVTLERQLAARNRLVTDAQKQLRNAIENNAPRSSCERRRIRSSTR